MTKTSTFRFSNAKEKAEYIQWYAVGQPLRHYKTGEEIMITHAVVGKPYKSHARLPRCNMIDITWTAA